MHFGRLSISRNKSGMTPAAGQTELTARVLRTTRLSGKVTLPDGKPAEGIQIQAEGRGESNMYCRRFDRSAADGSYSLEVDPDQDYIIAVVDESWAAPSHFGIEVEEGKPREGLDFHLGKGTLIRGKVATAPDNKPDGEPDRDGHPAGVE